MVILMSNATLIGDSKKVYPFIVQIGVGGTGGYVVQNLAQLLGAGGISHTYVLADPDVIEEKNLKNQLFIPEEVGFPKAQVLAERYNYAYNTNIHYVTDEYIEDEHSIMNLFNSSYIQEGDCYDTELVPILIGCVDNNFTRQIMERFVSIMPRIIYIDSGNESVRVPQDWRSRPMEQWSQEEVETYKNSGWSGQVVVGYKWQNREQPTVGKVFPDVLEDVDTIRPSSLSCTEVSSSDPQRLIVNKTAALAITGIVQELFDNRTISKHVTFFHALKGYMRSIQYEKEDTVTKQKKQPA